MSLRTGLSFVLSLLLSLLLVIAVDGQDHAQIPAPLLASALNHAAQSMPDGEDLIERLRSKDVDALYQVAKSMYGNPRPADSSVSDTGEEANDTLSAVQIYHALADGKAHHIMSMVQLGYAYSENDKSEAIKYFVQAGEDGNHQSSLYNAGRLLADEGDVAPALGYLRAAATRFRHAKKRDTSGGSDKMTATATMGYEALSLKLARSKDLSVIEMVDAFLYADMDDFPKEGSTADKLWVETIELLQRYGESNELRDLDGSRKKLSDLQKYKGEMSALQADFLQRILDGIVKMVRESPGDEL